MRAERIAKRLRLKDLVKGAHLRIQEAYEAGLRRGVSAAVDSIVTAAFGLSYEVS